VAFVSSIICCAFVSEWTLTWTPSPKPSLIKATRAIAAMGRKARRRKIRAAQKIGHPAIQAFWDPERLVK
jgi:hypothetical protein